MISRTTAWCERTTLGPQASPLPPVAFADQMLRNGDVEMAAREEEIRFLKMAQAEEQRALGLLQRGVPSKRQLEQEIVTLQIQVRDTGRYRGGGGGVGVRWGGVCVRGGVSQVRVWLLDAAAQASDKRWWGSSAGEGKTKKNLNSDVPVGIN